MNEKEEHRSEEFSKVPDLGNWKYLATAFICDHLWALILP
jgi:hypothetical protein